MQKNNSPWKIDWITSHSSSTFSESKSERNEHQLEQQQNLERNKNIESLVQWTKIEKQREINQNRRLSCIFKGCAQISKTTGRIVLAFIQTKNQFFVFSSEEKTQNAIFKYLLYEGSVYACSFAGPAFSAFQHQKKICNNAVNIYFCQREILSPKKQESAITAVDPSCSEEKRPSSIPRVFARGLERAFLNFLEDTCGIKNESEGLRELRKKLPPGFAKQKKKKR